jgi:hypothetical protein
MSIKRLFERIFFCISALSESQKYPKMLYMSIFSFSPAEKVVPLPKLLAGKRVSSSIPFHPPLTCSSPPSTRPHRHIPLWSRGMSSITAIDIIQRLKFAVVKLGEGVPASRGLGPRIGRFIPHVKCYNSILRLCFYKE